jgi:hypothetical protein
MAENDIVALKELASGGFLEVALAPADIAAAPASHTHAASAITSGVFDYARMAHVAQVNLLGDDETLNAGDYATNGNIIAHLRLRPEAADASITVTLPDLTSTSVGEVTLRAIRGGQDLQYGGFFLSVIDDNDAPIFGNPTDIDADEELTFRWNNGRWDLDLRPNPFATTAAFSIFKPNASGTLGLSEPNDSTFRIVGSSDATKKVAFEVDGLTTATTRTLTVPNASGTLVVSSTTGITGADAVTNIVSLTQAEYNAIGSPDAATLYLITDP